MSSTTPPAQVVDLASIAQSGMNASDNFAAWFAQSKVVADGKPLVVYHGTNVELDSFDPARVGKNFHYAKKGFFFTANAGAAAEYALELSGANHGQAPIPGVFRGTPADIGTGGSNILPVYLSIQNPLIVRPRGTRSPEQWFDYKADELYAKAAATGADGIIVQPGSYGFAERTLYVAFEPGQIKSAIGNSGLYLRGSPSLTDRIDPRPHHEAHAHRLSVSSTQETAGTPINPEQPWADQAIAANGRPIAKNFSDWFSGSKVIEDGREGDDPLAVAVPKTLYHATVTDFDAFRATQSGLKLMDGLGVHFGTLEAAHDRLRKSWGKAHEGSSVVPVFLRITSFPTKRDGSVMTEGELQAWLVKQAVAVGVDKHKTRAYSSAYPLRADVFIKLKAELTRRGFDGLAYVNSHEHRGSVSYAVFDPGQIKSAIGNSGLYMRDSVSLTDNEAAHGLLRAGKARMLVHSIADETGPKRPKRAIHA